MPFFKKKSDPKRRMTHLKVREETRDRKRQATQENDEALERLKKALKKLGPMDGASDLLGKG